MNTAQFVQIEGHRMSQLDEKQSYLNSSDFSDREKIALRYCDAIIGNPLHADDAMWEELHKHFTEPQLVELGHYIGFLSGGQRWLLTLHAQHGDLEVFMKEYEEKKNKK